MSSGPTACQPRLREPQERGVQGGGVFRDEGPAHGMNLRDQQEGHDGPPAPPHRPLQRHERRGAAAGGEQAARRRPLVVDTGWSTPLGVGTDGGPHDSCRPCRNKSKCT